MEFLQRFQPVAETRQKNESLVETALGMRARKGLASYPDISRYDTSMAILNIEGIKGGLESN
jgi:hypothetical protein